MLGAASTLIREWAESLLGLKFPTLSALARHLVDNVYVDTQSLSAICILCASGNSNASTNKGLMIITFFKNIFTEYMLEIILYVQSQIQIYVQHL